MSKSHRTAESDGGFGPLLLLMNLWCYGSLLLWTLFAILFFPLVFALCLPFLRWSADRLVRWFIWLYGRG